MSQKPKLASNGHPRRNQLQLFTHAERMLYHAVGEVEVLGCHPLLTEAVNLIQAAREKVADYVELPGKPVDSLPRPENAMLVNEKTLADIAEIIPGKFEASVRAVEERPPLSPAEIAIDAGRRSKPPNIVLMKRKLDAMRTYKSPPNGLPWALEGVKDLARQLHEAAVAGDSSLLERAACAARRLHRSMRMGRSWTPATDAENDAIDKRMDERFPPELFKQLEAKLRAAPTPNEPATLLHMDEVGQGVELIIDNQVNTYLDWIKGEGGDIGLLRARETNKVAGVHLPLKAKKLVVHRTVKEEVEPCEKSSPTKSPG